MFYNTTQERGEQLALFRIKAKAQDQVILDYMKAHSWRPFGASDLAFLCPGAPLNSIRRALNTLKQRGLIQMTQDKQPSLYGRPEHLWELTTVTEGPEHG